MDAAGEVEEHRHHPYAEHYRSHPAAAAVALAKVNLQSEFTVNVAWLVSDLYDDPDDYDEDEEFSLYLPYTISALTHALSVDRTTVTHLKIQLEDNDGNSYDPRHYLDGDDGLVDFLVDYVATSRRYHPNLRKLTLCGFTCDDARDGLMGVVQRLLRAVAGESSNVRHLCLREVLKFPVEILQDFCCHLSRSRVLKVLAFYGMDLLSVPSSGAPSKSQKDTICKVPLENLVLERVRCLRYTERADTENDFDLRANQVFSDLVRTQLQFSILTLGREVVNLGTFYRPNDAEAMRKQLFTSLMAQPLKRLEVSLGGNDTVKALTSNPIMLQNHLQELSVKIEASWDPLRDFPRLIDALHSPMAQLQSLCITFLEWPHYYGDRRIEALDPEMKRQIFRAIDANCTITNLQVTDETGLQLFTPDERQLLREGRTRRNRVLGKFLDHSTSRSSKDLLKLMLQLDHCPTGRYNLVRRALVPAGWFAPSPSSRKLACRKRMRDDTQIA